MPYELVMRGCTLERREVSANPSFENVLDRQLYTAIAETFPIEREDAARRAQQYALEEEKRRPARNQRRVEDVEEVAASASSLSRSAKSSGHLPTPLPFAGSLCPRGFAGDSPKPAKRGISASSKQLARTAATAAAFLNEQEGGSSSSSTTSSRHVHVLPKANPSAGPRAADAKVAVTTKPKLHERVATVAVHNENGRRVKFRTVNFQKRALGCPLVRKWELHEKWRSGDLVDGRDWGLPLSPNLSKWNAPGHAEAQPTPGDEGEGMKKKAAFIYCSRRRRRVLACRPNSTMNKEWTDTSDSCCEDAEEPRLSGVVELTSCSDYESSEDFDGSDEKRDVSSSSESVEQPEAGKGEASAKGAETAAEDDLVAILGLDDDVFGDGCGSDLGLTKNSKGSCTAAGAGDATVSATDEDPEGAEKLRLAEKHALRTVKKIAAARERAVSTLEGGRIVPSASHIALEKRLNEIFAEDGVDDDRQTDSEDERFPFLWSRPDCRWSAAAEVVLTSVLQQHADEAAAPRAKTETGKKQRVARPGRMDYWAWWAKNEEQLDWNAIGEEVTKKLELIVQSDHLVGFKRQRTLTALALDALHQRAGGVGPEKRGGRNALEDRYDVEVREISAKAEDSDEDLDVEAILAGRAEALQEQEDAPGVPADDEPQQATLLPLENNQEGDASTGDALVQMDHENDMEIDAAADEEGASLQQGEAELLLDDSDKNIAAAVAPQEKRGHGMLVAVLTNGEKVYAESEPEEVVGAGGSTGGGASKSCARAHRAVESKNDDYSEDDEDQDDADLSTRGMPQPPPPAERYSGRDCRQRYHLLRNRRNMDRRKHNNRSTSCDADLGMLDYGRTWTKQEDRQLLQLVAASQKKSQNSASGTSTGSSASSSPRVDWVEVTKQLGTNRTVWGVFTHYVCALDKLSASAAPTRHQHGLTTLPWGVEEEKTFRAFLSDHWLCGAKWNWKELSDRLATRRSPRRYHNTYLKNRIYSWGWRRGPFSEHEFSLLRNLRWVLGMPSFVDHCHSSVNANLEEDGRLRMEEGHNDEEDGEMDPHHPPLKRRKKAGGGNEAENNIDHAAAPSGDRPHQLVDEHRYADHSSLQGVGDQLKAGLESRRSHLNLLQVCFPDRSRIQIDHACRQQERGEFLWRRGDLVDNRRGCRRARNAAIDAAIKDALEADPDMFLGNWTELALHIEEQYGLRTDGADLWRRFSERNPLGLADEVELVKARTMLLVPKTEGYGGYGGYVNADNALSTGRSKLTAQDLVLDPEMEALLAVIFNCTTFLGSGSAGNSSCGNKERTDEGAGVIADEEGNARSANLNHVQARGRAQQKELVGASSSSSASSRAAADKDNAVDERATVDGDAATGNDTGTINHSAMLKKVDAIKSVLVEDFDGFLEQLGSRAGACAIDLPSVGLLPVVRGEVDEEQAVVQDETPGSLLVDLEVDELSLLDEGGVKKTKKQRLEKIRKLQLTQVPQVDILLRRALRRRLEEHLDAADIAAGKQTRAERKAERRELEEFRAAHAGGNGDGLVLEEDMLDFDDVEASAATSSGGRSSIGIIVPKNPPGAGGGTTHAAKAKAKTRKATTKKPGRKRKGTAIDLFAEALDADA